MATIPRGPAEMRGRASEMRRLLITIADGGYRRPVGLRRSRRRYAGYIEGHRAVGRSALHLLEARKFNPRSIGSGVHRIGARPTLLVNVRATGVSGPPPRVRQALRRS